MSEVSVFEVACREDFVGVSEALHDGLKFLDDFGDCFVVFEVVLDDDAEEWSVLFLFEGSFLDLEFDGRVVSWVEDGVGGFRWVGDEVVCVEVVDEVVEVCLGEGLENVVVD